ncbi:MAG: signal peptidase I [Patescibacteria group bacterium]
MEINKENLKHNTKEVLKFIVELVKVAFISLAIIIPVRYFLIQPFYVKGASMEPTFEDKEYLIVNEIGYRFEKPSRGDVIVFKYPLDPKSFFIKRVIGLPGERITIKDGEVRIYNAENINGTVLDESGYLMAGLETSGDIDKTLAGGEYFVMGDNRNASMDSRSFGIVPEANIVGRAWVRGWPLDKMDVFKKLIYNL